jgi:hypothetical protein
VQGKTAMHTQYNNTHKITTTIHTIKSTTITHNDNLKLATIHPRKIRILPNKQKVIIQTKAEIPEQVKTQNKV